MLGDAGNDVLIGSKLDDILDGGTGNDKLKGGKGADTYILSPGKDKFLGFKLKEGDSIEIDSSIDFKLNSKKNTSFITHEDGVTAIKKVSVSDLVSVIEIV